jgi:hypothetical protein
MCARYAYDMHMICIYSDCSVSEHGKHWKAFICFVRRPAQSAWSPQKSREAKCSQMDLNVPSGLSRQWNGAKLSCGWDGRWYSYIEFSSRMSCTHSCWLDTVATVVVCILSFLLVIDVYMMLYVVYLCFSENCAPQNPWLVIFLNTVLGCPHPFYCVLDPPKKICIRHNFTEFIIIPYHKPTFSHVTITYNHIITPL